MNMQGAFEELISVWKLRDATWTRPYRALADELSLQHAEDMLSRITPEFSEAKLGRWLGWAQAAMVAQGLASLDEMKELNKKYADD